MENNNITMEQAVELFDQQKYREAFAIFAEIYNQCQDKNERQAIFEMLNEAFYAPNMEELQANYVRNLQALEKYPYFWDKEFHQYAELTFQLFPVSDEHYYCYSKEKDCFWGEYDAKTHQQMRYFFENTDDPFKAENEDNFYNLNFLNDNVRASEDYAGDNHIYLVYSTLEPLERLMLTCDLESVLRQEKFVFLVGEKNKIRYPLDFKGHFGIDYAARRPKELSVSEIKRIFFSWKIAGASGTGFFADIMDFHPDLLTIPDALLWFADLYTEQLEGKPRSEAISFLKRLPDKDPKKSNIMNLVHSNSETLSESLRKELNRVSAEEFLTVLDSVLADIPRPSAREWLIGIYLAYSRCHGRSFGRAIPALFLYPHDDFFYMAGFDRNRAVFYFDLVGSFPYHKAVVLIRDPLTQTGSITNLMTYGLAKQKNTPEKIQTDPFYAMMFASVIPKDYYFSLTHPLWESSRVVRFEDLKLNPKATMASMAEFLNIPVTQSMFRTTQCGQVSSGVSTDFAVFEGFDPAPIYKSYDKILSIFDKYRIELLLRDLIKTYGYQTKYYDGQQFSDAEIVRMMELPFLCESIKTVLPLASLQAGRKAAMRFIKLAVAIKEFPFAAQTDKGMEQFAPLPWLQPKEELLEQPLYR